MRTLINPASLAAAWGVTETMLEKCFALVAHPEDVIEAGELHMAIRLLRHVHVEYCAMMKTRLPDDEDTRQALAVLADTVARTTLRVVRACLARFRDECDQYLAELGLSQAERLRESVCALTSM